MRVLAQQDQTHMATEIKPSNPNQVVWFDMPIIDLERAVRFYSAVLGGAVQKQQFSGIHFAVLPHQEGAVSGCLVPSDDKTKPSANGPLLYLNCQGRLDEAVAVVEPNGGKVLQPKH